MANVLSTDKQIAVIGALAEEMFELHGHPKAPKAYAWAHHTDGPESPKRHVTVLPIGPVTSAVEAVRAAIVEEFRSRESEAEA